MKIRLVHSIWDLSVMGGAEKMLFNLAKRFNPDKFDLIVLSMIESGDFGKALKEQGIQVASIEPKGFRKGWNPIITYKVFKFLNDFRPHIVHVHLEFNTILAASLSRVPIIIRHEHNIYPNLRGLKKTERVIADKFVDRVVAISKSVADATLKREGLQRSKINIIPIGMIPEDMRANRKKEEIRNELGLPLDAKVLISVASLGEKKGHTYLLQAFQDVLRKDMNAWLLLVGTGELKSRLASEAIQLGISERVIFTGKRDDVINLLSASDIFVLASLWEGTPLALMEASFMGLPCVASAVGGIPEMVQPGVNAILVPPGQPSILSSALIDLLDNPQRSAKIGEAARRHASSHFCINNQIHELECFYEELLQEKKVVN